jgi:Zn finger protein HypA/HybF involved in hydrogenase expression
MQRELRKALEVWREATRALDVAIVKALDDGLESIECEECGKMFTPGRTWQKFCSRKCGNKVRARRHDQKDREDIERYAADITELERDAMGGSGG